MTLKVHTSWITGSYQGDVLLLLKIAENNELRLGTSTAGLHPHLDSASSLAIGYGYDLVQNKTTAIQDLTNAGAVISNANSLQQLLNTLKKPVTAAQKAAVSNLLNLPSETVAAQLLEDAIAKRETSFDTFLTNVGLSIPESNERSALMSLWYQGQEMYFGTPQAPSKLTSALNADNRAEAWFEIRYRSAADGGGVITRRFVDSQLFGLFDDPSSPSQSEVIQAYAMLTAHRSTIIAYEVKNGTSPDGSSPLLSAGLIRTANTTYGLAGTTNEVQTLAQVFVAAETGLLNFLRGVSPLLADLSDTFARCTDIFAASDARKTAIANAGDVVERPGGSYSTTAIDTQDQITNTT